MYPKSKNSRSLYRQVTTLLNNNEVDSNKKEKQIRETSLKLGGLKFKRGS
jgi:hypothetical protein